MRVAGIDFSSHAVDVVTVPYEGTGAPVWTRFPLVGTTLLVARQHGRHSIGIELSEEYVKLAADRLSQLSLLAETNA